MLNNNNKLLTSTNLLDLLLEICVTFLIDLSKIYRCTEALNKYILSPFLQ